MVHLIVDSCTAVKFSEPKKGIQESRLRFCLLKFCSVPVSEISPEEKRNCKIDSSQNQFKSYSKTKREGSKCFFNISVFKFKLNIGHISL